MNEQCGLLATLLPEQQGFEFDWLAVDSAGQLAILSTSGEGFIPCSVATHYEQYSEVSDLFGTPNIGTTKIWEDYANYGLFVYDWDAPDGRAYLLKARPRGLMPHSLRDRILSITDLPRFGGLFSEQSVISRWR